MAKAPSRGRGKSGAARKSPPSGKKSGKGSSSKASKPSRPAPSRNLAGVMPVICSECYSDFQLSSTAPGTQITCPECMHLGTIEDGDVVAQVAIAKKAEKTSLIVAMAGAFLIVALFAYYQYTVVSNGAIEAGMHWGLVGGAGVCFLITLIFGVKFERNRHEVYF